MYKMYHTVCGIICGFIITYIFSKIVGLSMEGSHGMPSCPGSGQILVFFGILIGLSIGVGIDIGTYINN
jgi:hypothetical protein